MLTGYKEVVVNNFRDMMHDNQDSAHGIATRLMTHSEASQIALSGTPSR
jgi:hypothetical protein